MIPRARTVGVTTSELNDETLVYDLERHRVHRLNRTAALVWKRCDGRRSVAHIAAELEQTLAAPGGEELVRQALDQLQQAHLLEEPGRLSRREFAGRARLTGALLLLAPVVTSIAAPTAAQAQSGRNRIQRGARAGSRGPRFTGDGGGGGNPDLAGAPAVAGSPPLVGPPAVSSPPLVGPPAPGRSRGVSRLRVTNRPGTRLGSRTGQARGSIWSGIRARLPRERWVRH